MKHEHKSLLIFGALFLVAGYIYEKNYSPLAVQQAQITQLQKNAQLGSATVDVTPAPIPTNLVEYTGE